MHHGRTDVFTAESGLSGNIIAGLFEDREGNIWVSTAGGLDRFRELPVTTVSTKQGLSSDNVSSVIATTDGSTWIATRDGLTRWQKGQTTIFRKADGLPDDMVQSMYQDHAGRIWVFTGHGLAWFNNGRFVSVDGVPSTEVYSITGDNAGNLWLSGNNGLSHLRDGRLIENLPWTALGRRQQAKVIIFDQDRGGLWLGFWQDGGVEYFKDGQVRTFVHRREWNDQGACCRPSPRSGWGRVGCNAEWRRAAHQRRPDHYPHNQQRLAVRQGSLDNRGG